MAYKVPEFGKWNAEEKITYTASFENARKVRNSRAMMDPSILHQQRDSFQPENEASAQHPAPPLVGISKAQGKQSKVVKHGMPESQNSMGSTVHLDNAQKKKNNAFYVKALLDRNYKIPEFGKWQEGQNITYTASFENARRVRSSCAIMDPSCVDELTEMIPDNKASAEPPRSAPRGQQAEVRKNGVPEIRNIGYAAHFDKAQKKKSTAQGLLDQSLKVSKSGGASEGAENCTGSLSQSAAITKNKGSILKSNDHQQNVGTYPQFGGRRSQDHPTQYRVDSQGHRSKVPQFGAWEKGEDVGYTVCFENARKGGITGRVNDSSKLNQGILPPSNPPAQAHSAKAKAKTKLRAAAQQRKELQFGAWEGGGEIAYTSYFNNIRKNNNKNGSEAILEPSYAPKEACSKMPQFGAWEGGEDVAYTVCFDNAQKNRNGGSRSHSFEPKQNHNVSDRARPPTAATEARVKERRKQNFGCQWQSPLHSREEKLRYRTAARQGVPTSKVAKSGAWEDGEIFKAYCNVIESGQPPTEQLSRGRGSTPQF